MKFKVGDYLGIIKGDGMWTKGEIARITSLKGDHNRLSYYYKKFPSKKLYTAEVIKSNIGDEIGRKFPLPKNLLFKKYHDLE